MKIPEIFILEKSLEDSLERLLKEEKSSVQPNYTKFEVICANTYAEGIVELKEQGRKPFTLSENIEARIVNYKADDENAELFDAHLDSVTGVAYKAKSTKFKLILRSDKLENIAKDFIKSFIPVNYNTEQGIELDSTKDKYNQQLTREEAKNHGFWIAAMNGNKEKLAQYVDLWFDKRRIKEGMGVYLRSDTSQDELRALGLGNDGYISIADGNSDLYGIARFVSGAR